MKKIAILTVILIPLFSWAVDAPDWSESVRSVSARLIVKPTPESPFLKVYIEFKNDGHAIPIPFSPNKLSLLVKNKNGEVLKPDFSVDRSGSVPNWESPYLRTLLHADSVYRFVINRNTVGYSPKREKRIIDMNDLGVWWIRDSGDYTISGTLKIERDTSNGHAWFGELKLPETTIPQNEYSNANKTAQVNPVTPPENLRTP